MDLSEIYEIAGRAQMFDSSTTDPQPSLIATRAVVNAVYDEIVFALGEMADDLDSKKAELLAGGVRLARIRVGELKSEKSRDRHL